VEYAGIRSSEAPPSLGGEGNPPCEHPEIDKEYYLGSDTGDVVCKVCGETWPHSDPNRPGRT
jgi:hypothetical protein